MNEQQGIDSSHTVAVMQVKSSITAFIEQNV